MDKEFSRWADLPSCLLYEISDRLIFYDDYVRFSAVCVSWRTVYDDDQKKKKKSSASSSSLSSLPFLLIPPHNHELVGKIVIRSIVTEEQAPEVICNIEKQIKEVERKRRLVPQIRNLYNVVNKKVFDFEVKLSHNYYCRGSSFGWLITFKPKMKFGNYYKYYVQLYNPFLSDEHNIINIPPFYKSIQQHFDHYRPLLYLKKAVLSSNPLFAPNNDDFVVMAIVGVNNKLAFYRSGNKDWTPINYYKKYYDSCCFKDIIYFNKTKQFYAVLATGEVLAIDLITDQGGGGGTPKLTQVAPPTHNLVERHGQRYLVETLSGELLQVHKIFVHYKRRSKNKYVKIKVLKLDPVTVQWSQIHDMGDTILFIGDNSSMSHSASEFPGCKPNSIYYTDDLSMEEMFGWQYKPQDMGIYNLADGSHQPHYPTASRINFPAPIWIEPTLQRCNHLRYLNEGSNTQLAHCLIL